MRVIARIPDGSEPAAVAGGVAAWPRATAERPVPRPGRTGPRKTRPWPTWPVAALALVAVLAWILATWNDHERLRRQRSDARLALEPAATTRAESATAPRGAVVR